MKTYNNDDSVCFEIHLDKSVNPEIVDANLLFEDKVLDSFTPITPEGKLPYVLCTFSEKMVSGKYAMVWNVKLDGKSKIIKDYFELSGANPHIPDPTLPLEMQGMGL